MVRDRLFRVIALKQSYEKRSYLAQAILKHSRCLLWKKSIMTQLAIRRIFPNPVTYVRGLSYVLLYVARMLIQLKLVNSSMHILSKMRKNKCGTHIVTPLFEILISRKLRELVSSVSCHKWSPNNEEYACSVCLFIYVYSTSWCIWYHRFLIRNTEQILRNTS